MKTNKKLLALFLVMIITITTFTYATNVSTTMDKDGFYTITTTESLNPFTETTIPLPTPIKATDVQGFSMLENGKFINVNIFLKENNIVVSPRDSFKTSLQYVVRIFTKDKHYSISMKASKYTTEQSYDGVILKIPSNSAKGFNYPYYLYLPTDIEKNTSIKHMIVEPNNTGTVSDDMQVHDKRAHWEAYANGNPAHKTAEALKLPMLVPVFPRPTTPWYLYTHDLDRNTMLINSGEMKRLDLQLIQMIKDAQEMLATQGIKTEKKIFMTGYSASAKFTNKFISMHPELVKAAATGGVNAYTILPTSSYNGITLNYPVGVADLKTLTGYAFNETEYKKVAQYIYMGDADTNDILAAGYDNEEGEQIKATARKILGEKMMPERWNNLVAIYKKLGYDSSIQLHLYKGIGHEFTENTNADILEFFKANSGTTIKKITPHINGR